MEIFRCFEIPSNFSGVLKFITDVIDDKEVKTGVRDDRTVYAVYSFARKSGQALGGALKVSCRDKYILFRC